MAVKWEQYWPHGWYVPNMKWYRKKSKRAREKEALRLLRLNEEVTRQLKSE